MSVAPTRAKGRLGEPVLLLFPWRGGSRSLLTPIVPIVLATAVFAGLLGLLRIKVAEPQFKMTRKASWIQLPASSNGVSWALRAKEGGPLLARYEPAEWGAYSALAQEVLQATRIPTHTYVPSLRNLPSAPLAQAQSLADKGDPLLPHRVALAQPRLDLPASHLAPVLYPLSAVGPAGLPRALPALAGHIDAVMAATDWRFLLRLDTRGGVADVVSLTKATGTAALPLENWLRGVVFDSKLAADGGWLAVGIRFNNQPSNGTDPH
ncbi:MAG: hypothetical protein DVB26_02475 [Verrucomicrobia bacterium]|nr:MAG: hypothetical protein DVB26_02475 [Verrucomicrobiota bacterium]